LKDPDVRWRVFYSNATYMFCEEAREEGVGVLCRLFFIQDTCKLVIVLNGLLGDSKTIIGSK